MNELTKSTCFKQKNPSVIIEPVKEETYASQTLKQYT